MQSETPAHEGCKWCCSGHAPTWKWDPNLPEGGEFVHIIQNKSEDGRTTQVVSTVCVGAHVAAKS